MRKKIILSAIFLGLVTFLFTPTNFAKATLLTCGGDKTEADCISAGGTVVTTGTCTSCSISGTTCPSGMKQYLSWAYYPSKSCGSSSEICNTGDCGTRCATGSTCSVGSGWFNSDTHNCSYGSVYDGSVYMLKSPTGGTACNQCGVQYYDAYFFVMDSKDWVKCFKMDTNSLACSSTKSNVACIGSGATPASAVIQGKHVLMPNNQEDASIQTVSVSGGSSSALNPYSISVLAGATYTVSISPRAGYSVGYTLCIDSASCHTLTPTPGNTATVVIPSGKLSNKANHYADLWWHYTPIPVPTLDFSLSSGDSSATIINGDSITLAWTVTNATSCTATGDWGIAEPTPYTDGTHNQIITPTEGTKIYNLECFNPAGSPIQTGIKTVTVDVIPAIPPSCTFPTCGSDCGIIKKSYCMSGGNIRPETDCGGGAGCDDVVCNSCQWKETSP